MRLRPLLCLLPLVLASHAWAWGAFGHKTIALIAWSELSSDQKERVNQIFAKCPSIYGSQQGTEAMMYAAVWPDLLREGHRMKHMDEPLEIFGPIHATQSSQKAVDNLHFADYDSSGQWSEPGDNVYDGIKCAILALRDPQSSDRGRGEALSFLIHLIGDAHQPLHCGHAEDKGGNDIALAGLGSSRARTELHAVWDTGLFHTTRISDPEHYMTERLTPLLPRLRQAALGDLDPNHWIEQSHQMAETMAYVDEGGLPIQSGQHLSEAYVQKNLPVADACLVVAGLRTAAVMRWCLSGP